MNKKRKILALLGILAVTTFLFAMIGFEISNIASMIYYRSYGELWLPMTILPIFTIVGVSTFLKLLKIVREER